MAITWFRRAAEQGFAEAQFNLGVMYANGHGVPQDDAMAVTWYRRAAEQGVACNIFSNHIWYFGDQHVAYTIGLDRARRMDALRTALDEGVCCAIHSDAPVTPLGPLFTAWCAVNRQTMSGMTLGAGECITVAEALELITLGAARTLKLDGEIGSISPGKWADFAILGDDPFSVDETKLKDIPVLGTVFGGQINLI